MKQIVDKIVVAEKEENNTIVLFLLAIKKKHYRYLRNYDVNMYLIGIYNFENRYSRCLT